MDGKFVSYLRVSTAKQGTSGLGLEAQRAAVAGFLNGGNWSLLGEHVEVESGKNNDRRELRLAMDRCRRTGATLLVAKLDRLSRNAHFLIGLRDAGVDFVAVDMPQANKLTVGIMALVAEQEREAISARTKAALTAAKARGKVLGGYRGKSVPDAALATAARQERADAFAADMAPLARRYQAEGKSLRAIAAAFDGEGYRTPRGGAWTAQAIKNLLARA
jgi:DNA invertase Pin-like site-specific DNA recombinase